MGDGRRIDQWWPYDSVSRRRGRSVGRVVDATVRGGGTRPALLPAYWWDGHPNFGDALTPWVLARYGIVAVHTPPRSARLVGVGSILEHVPDSFDGVIWGSGLLHGKATRIPDAQVLALRGPLTRDALGVTGDVALGDPGILVGRHIFRQQPRWSLGVIPHGLHRRDPGLQEFQARAGKDVTMIDVRARPGSVIRRIASCAAVVTTSLHGLIVADSLGIPASWTRRQPDLWGGDFKFRDYEAVLTPGRSREVVVAPDSTLADVLTGAEYADEDARAESIHRLESTIPRLPVVRDHPWRSFSG